MRQCSVVADATGILLPNYRGFKPTATFKLSLPDIGSIKCQHSLIVALGDHFLRFLERVDVRREIDRFAVK